MTMVFLNISERVVFLSLVWLFRCIVVHGFNYLVQPFGGEGSHFVVTARIAEALVHRGHNVSFLINSDCFHHKLDSRWKSLFDFVIYDSPGADNPWERAIDEFVALSYEKGIEEGMVKLFPKITTTLAVDCETILSDETLITKLRDKQFDLLMYDGNQYCGPVLADKVNLKTILVHASAYHGGMAGVFGASPGLSYIPFQVEDIPIPPLSFYQRLHSVYTLLYHAIMISMGTFPTYVAIRDKFNISPHLSINEFLRSRVQLVLMNIDPEVDVLAPLTPNIIPVGGLTTSPAQKLPTELDQIMDTSTQGVIVFSLGSFVKVVPRRVQDVIIEALSLLPYQVFFKFDNKDNITLPPNVKALNWLPQNDLLGHEKTKVLVCQGGNNGFYEAIYHGVPMVILPVLGDQGQVASRVETHGIGVSLNVRTMTSHDLKDAIVHVMTDKMIRQNIQRVRDIYHHKPMNATQKAAYWVEHVTKFGGLPYKPNAFHLNPFQNGLLDVIGFILAVLLCFLFAVCKSCLLCCRCVLQRVRQGEDHLRSD